MFITIPWFYPAYKAGGPVQSIVNLVNTFNKNISYYIFTSDKDLDGSELKVTGDTWIFYKDHVRVWYSGSKEVLKNMREQENIIKPDLIFIIGIFSWKYNVLPLLFSGVKRKVLSVRGMLHPGALTQKKIKKSVFLSVLKLLSLQKKVTFHATDNTEAGYIQKIFGEVKINVANNFPANFNYAETVVKERGSVIMSTIALISPMKNHLLVLKALKEVKANITYNITGPVKDINYWNLCLEEMKDMPSNIKVTYRGEVIPSKIYSVLKETHISVLPSKSENFGHAIFESLSAGRPVITSENTPWNGLKENSAGINSGTDVKSLQRAIELFAEMDNEEYLLYSKAAAKYARKNLNLDSLVREYENLFSIAQPQITVS